MGCFIFNSNKTFLAGTRPVVSNCRISFSLRATNRFLNNLKIIYIYIISKLIKQQSFSGICDLLIYYNIFITVDDYVFLTLNIEGGKIHVDLYKKLETYQELRLSTYFEWINQSSVSMDLQNFINPNPSLLVTDLVKTIISTGYPNILENILYDF